MMASTSVFAAETETQSETQTEEAASENDAESVFPFTLVTKDDQEVTFTHVPERVISTNPNTGEELMALGLEQTRLSAPATTTHSFLERYREEVPNPNRRSLMTMAILPWK